ncbi:MAG: agmatine deiminase family protein [Pseudobdellovibrionaceae bacterium]
MRSLLLLSVCLFVSTVHAVPRLNKNGTPEEMQNAARANRVLLQSPLAKIADDNFAPLGPVEDHATFKYLLVNAYDSYGDSKQIMAQNLPENMTMIVLATPADRERMKKQFSQWVPENRLIVVSHRDAQGGFWSRDSFPVPVYRDEDKNVGLIAARYYRPFDGQETIAKTVRAIFNKSSLIFVGGNLLADEEGQCFTVNSYRLFDMTADAIKTLYGCKNVEVLPHLVGLGDIDEVIKPLSGKRMLTNVSRYIPRLKEMGYEVIELPEAGGMRTYINSTILGSTVFMPVYGTERDQVATKVYEDLGYKVVPINSVELSDYGSGSIHCITMAYPEMDLQALFSYLGVEN